MTEVTPELKASADMRRRLMAQVRSLEVSAGSASSRLKLMLLKRDLQDVVRDLREQQSLVGQQMSRSTAVTQAVNAYARTAQAWTNKGR